MSPQPHVPVGMRMYVPVGIVTHVPVGIRMYVARAQVDRRSLEEIT